jgi:hypothetical protein
MTTLLTRAVRSRRAHVITAAVAVSALLALCLLATMAPATNSAYVAKIANSTNTITTAPATCAGAATLDRAATPAIFQYALNDYVLLLNPTAADASGSSNPGTYRGLLSLNSFTTPIACSRDTGPAFVFDGISSFVSSAKTTANPQSYSVELWFKTTVAAGRLIGIGNSQTGTSSTYDRHIYIDTSGKLEFGSYNGGTQVIVSPTAVTDGKWHLVVGTQSPTTGMILYLDGVQVAANAAYTTSENNTGYWRLGYDNLAGWPNIPTSYYFSGSMRFAAAYSGVLTAAQVKADYLAGS